MTNSPLEFLAKKYGNVVKYDKEGNVAGIFVRFDKRKSSDLVAELPEHTPYASGFYHQWGRAGLYSARKV